MVIVGAVYKHFKGEEKLYRVLRLAVDCENINRKLVVYEQLYGAEDFPKGTIWVRELSDFEGYKMFLDGRRIKRFELVEK